MNSLPPHIGTRGDNDNRGFIMVINGKLPTVAAKSAHASQSRDVDSVILTKQEAANYVRCTPRYLERQISAGRLKALKPTGKLVRIRRADLDAFLESGATIGV
jgi:excisionase family DNA binding protein